MTNNKMSLGERIGLSIATISMLGMTMGAGRSIMYSSQVYPTLNKEASVIYQLEHLKDNTLFDETITSLEYYSTFRNDYSTNLENKLQRIRDSPEYVAEQQKKEEDKKSSDNAATVSLLSLLVCAVGFGYAFRSARKREETQQLQTVTRGK